MPEWVDAPRPGMVVAAGCTAVTVDLPKVAGLSVLWKLLLAMSMSVGVLALGSVVVVPTITLPSSMLTISTCRRDASNIRSDALSNTCVKGRAYCGLLMCQALSSPLPAADVMLY